MSIVKDKHSGNDSRQEKNFEKMRLHSLPHIALILAAFFLLPVNMQAQQYRESDSVKVATLLEEARQQPADTNWMLYFARQLTGIPYVAKTLEVNNEEQLIVNLRQLDCTTYVETVTALSLCMKRKHYTFEDYCRYLRLLRYKRGEVSYVNRLHYFTSWIADNTCMGFVAEPNKPIEAFPGTQELNINYMSTHVSQYPMLVTHRDWVADIRQTEEELTGKTFPFIPKGKLANTDVFWEAIQDGDIIAICTSKAGLDTSHIGIAVWHVDGLHLLNASQIHKKTIEEPMTMYNYMQKHPSQTGIRVIRLL